MPPIEPSLRASLLTGASALALSVVGTGADAQSIVFPQGGPKHDTWSVWIEGAEFWTSGGSFNIPSLQTFGAPFISFKPPRGLEGAVGFDYQWQNQPWHFVFDFRYGRSRTSTSSSSGSSSSHSTTFINNGPCLPCSNSTLLTTTINKAFSKSFAEQASEWESHAVLDFMIGRDMGMGASKGEVQFGVRVADLYASAHAQASANSLTIISGHSTFYAPSHHCCNAVTSILPPSSSSSSSFFSAAWNSHFFGVGPRAAITNSVPIVGFWSFDYEAGIAGLFGRRIFNFNFTGSTGSGGLYSGPVVGVFNADGWAALTYAFSSQFKVSGGVRGDFYSAALTTYDINTGGLQSIDRGYWGYFIRLTGTFN